MKTAWEMLGELGIEVPAWTPPIPEDREAARDAFRLSLKALQDMYREKMQDLRYPPDPGPRPKQYVGAPEFPHAMTYPPEPQRPGQPIGLSRYPSAEEITNYIAVGGSFSDRLPSLATADLRAAAIASWQAEMAKYDEAIREYTPRYQKVRDEETRVLLEYKDRNETWLDTVFYPGEAERAIWEVANEVLEESKRRIRAEADLARDELDIMRVKQERERLQKLEVAGAAPVADATDSKPKTDA